MSTCGHEINIQDLLDDIQPTMSNNNWYLKSSKFHLSLSSFISCACIANLSKSFFCPTRPWSYIGLVFQGQNSKVAQYTHTMDPFYMHHQLRKWSFEIAQRCPKLITFEKGKLSGSKNKFVECFFGRNVQRQSRM